MKPDRWKQISLLFKVALERDPAERAAFLAEECPDDEELRTAVESLLASHEQAEEGDFIGSSAFSSSDAAERETEDKPEVVPGQTTLGSYRILEKLGEGGMGAVYLAKDARLGRRVALKLLPTHFARDDERVRRFEQEARAASALNHPNILTVHEIGESEGRRFIVTEFVEGRTLRERLAEGRFSVAEALDVCAQVAGALAKAHASGIVHRDIKPGRRAVRRDRGRPAPRARQRQGRALAFRERTSERTPPSQTTTRLQRRHRPRRARRRAGPRRVVARRASARAAGARGVEETAHRVAATADDRAAPTIDRPLRRLRGPPAAHRRAGRGGRFGVDE